MRTLHHTRFLKKHKKSNIIKIAKMLHTNKTLLKLNLVRNYLNNEEITKISNVLCTNKTLQELNLICIGIKTENAVCFANMLRINRSLLKLDLSDNSIGSDGVIQILDALCINKSLQKINLSNTVYAYTQIDTAAVANMLRVNCSLLKLDLSKNKIESNVVTQILDALCINKSLRKINLSNTITQIDTTAVANMLFVNDTLCSLNLSYNHINTLKSIELLKNNFTLHTLNLEWNNIDCESIIKLVEPSNSSLHKLILTGNLMTLEMVTGLCNMMCTNTSLRKLCLNATALTYDCGVKIAEMLRINKTLHFLDLSDNNIGSGIICIAESMRVNESLASLILSDNDINKQDIDEIIDILYDNYSLTWINLNSEKESKIDEIITRNDKLIKKRRFVATKPVFN